MIEEIRLLLPLLEQVSGEGVTFIWAYFIYKAVIDLIGFSFLGVIIAICYKLIKGEINKGSTW